jgi:hypothetical protein
MATDSDLNWETLKESISLLSLDTSKFTAVWVDRAKTRGTLRFSVRSYKNAEDSSVTRREYKLLGLT